MHYANEANSVRVDFFKPSGKWYTTEAMAWTGGYFKDEVLIHDAFALSLYKHLRKGDEDFRFTGMVAVCLHPYHELAHPLMMKVDDAITGAKVKIEERKWAKIYGEEEKP